MQLIRGLIVFLLLAAPGVPLAEAQTDTAVTPGVSRTYSTIYSIGIEWDIAGDSDHDAVVTVMYRVAGTSTWTAALPLVRVDANGSNMHAGSVFFLAPATQYDLRVALSDPDGGAETRTLTVMTRRLPAMPVGGRTFHVVPGVGGGTGSDADPFRGIAAAAAVAQPGDVFLLHAGNYGGRIGFDRAGSASSYIVWKAAGDGDVIMNGIDIGASNIWLEGLTVRDVPFGARSIGAPSNVVVTRSKFLNNHDAMYLMEGGEGWYIADNIITGDTFYASESLSGEGIDLNLTSGHSVAHNSITNVADAISAPRRNVDIFGNDIFDTSDDGIEPDGGFGNIRIWGNRIHNAVHNGISFQPQNNAPWYIIRNQIVSNVEAAMKFRTTDRFVLLHNTIVNWGTAWPGDAMMCCNEGHLLRGIARNNLWVSVQGGQIWGFDDTLADWRTDLDFDGFDYGTATNPFAYAGATYSDLRSFAAATGLERNAIVISKNTCFEAFDVPSPPLNPVPAQAMTLSADCNAIDAGVVLPNISAQLTGQAPDLGAYEFGVSVPVYGPRRSPFNGTVRSIPGIVQAEDFDEDGPGVAYHDTTAGNRGNAYRPTDVDIQATTDVGGGHNIGWITAGEWLVYGVRVPTRGEYQLNLRVAAQGPGGRLHVEFDGMDRTGPLTIPDTGGWQQWTTVRTPVTLAAGPQLMRVVFDATGPTGVFGNLNYIQIISAAPNVAPTVTVTQPSTAATFVAPASISVMATASDTDGIITRVDFYSGTTLLGSDTTAPYEFTWKNVVTGTYVLSAAATDEDGAHAQSAGVSVTVTNSNAGDIVLHAGTAATRKGTWTVQQDATAASGVLVSHPDRGVPKLETPLASPTNYFEMTFEADAGRPYRLWMRGRAEANQYSNDSAYVQFSDSVDQSGAPIWRIGTTSATTYVLEDCSGCRLSGWGWQDNGYGVGVLGPLVRFASTGTHTIRVQGREDGLALDQIVLSSVAYVDAAPGSPTNDNTILPSSQAPSGPAPGSREIIIAASAFQARAGTYVTRADATAATGSYVVQPNLGAAKLTSPLPDPQHYVEYEFTPVAGVAYRLWIRGIAENDDWANDSAYVQFSNSVTATGQPTFRIGTSSATTYILEECSGCPMSRWGWEDNGYGSGARSGHLFWRESPTASADSGTRRWTGVRPDRAVHRPVLQRGSWSTAQRCDDRGALIDGVSACVAPSSPAAPSACAAGSRTDRTRQTAGRR